MWSSPANKELSEAVMRKLMDGPLGSEIQAEGEAARLRAEAQRELAALNETWSARLVQLKSALNSARAIRDEAKVVYEKAQRDFEKIADELASRQLDLVMKRAELKSRVTARRSVLVR